MDLKAAGYIVGKKTNKHISTKGSLLRMEWIISRVIQIFKIHLSKSSFETLKGVLIPVISLSDMTTSTQPGFRGMQV